MFKIFVETIQTSTPTPKGYRLFFFYSLTTLAAWGPQAASPNPLPKG